MRPPRSIVGHHSCDIDCAEGYANFDEAKGCANAGKGYCCKDTKPAKYPFTPNTK